MKHLLIMGIAVAMNISLGWGQRVPKNPTHNVGVESCCECHGEMVAAWEKTDHFRSFDALASSDAAKQMAEILSIKPADIPSTESCVRCHYTRETFAAVPLTTAGVSCESCHGGGAGWMDEHNRKSLSRAERVDYSSRLGMIHPESIHLITKTCYECHVVDDEQLVNVAGHPAISDGFDFLSWYSGEVKHNFLVQNPGKKTKSSSKSPQAIPQARKRMLYLSGKLHHLTHTLKAISGARDAPVDKDGKFIMLENGRYTFAVQHSLVLEKLKKDLEEVQKKTSISQYTEALVIVRSLKMTTGESKELAAAAESIGQLAEKFCAEHTGKEFAAIDPILEKLKPRVSSRE